jgi:hypothetical protein
MLNEMLNNAKPQERFVEGDAYDVREGTPGSSLMMTTSRTANRRQV